MGDNDSTTIGTETGSEGANPVAIIDEDVLRGKIHVVRGQKVMLDFELAEIYGYTTKAFNQQVRRNIEKFDDDFMFQVSEEEIEILRSQFVTSRSKQDNPTNLRSKNSTSSWGGTRYLPYAFTEQGVYMLMTVLKGELATRQSKALIRLFKHMKDHVIENQGIIGQREFLLLSMRVTDNLRDILDLRVSLDETDAKMAQVVEQLAQAVTRSELSDMMLDFGNPAVRRDYLLLNNQPVEAAAAHAELYGSAHESILIVDNYIGLGTLLPLKAVHPGVAVTVASDNVGRGLHAAELATFRAEYPGVDVSFVRTCGKVHDRYIALDYGTRNERAFLCGASSKDAGTRASTILEAERPGIFRELFDELLANPPLELG